MTSTYEEVTETREYTLTLPDGTRFTILTIVGGDPLLFYPTESDLEKLNNLQKDTKVTLEDKANNSKQEIRLIALQNRIGGDYFPVSV